MAYWKIWGHSMTCSECGYCGIYTGDYCPQCGVKMDEEARWWSPPLTLPKLPRTIKCAVCGELSIETLNYCHKCGHKFDKSNLEPQELEEIVVKYEKRINP